MLAISSGLLLSKRSLSRPIHAYRSIGSLVNYYLAFLVNLNQTWLSWLRTLLNNSPLPGTFSNGKTK